MCQVVKVVLHVGSDEVVVVLVVGLRRGGDVQQPGSWVCSLTTLLSAVSLRLSPTNTDTPTPISHSHPPPTHNTPTHAHTRTIYSMMGTFFIQQGSLMDNSIPLPAFLGGGGGGDCGLSSSSSGSGSSGSSGSSGDSSSGGACLHIPAATMALFNTGAIILLVPLYDAFLEPAIKAAGVKWTLLRRIGGCLGVCWGWGWGCV